MTDVDIQKELKPLLGPSEEIVWMGCPRRGIIFRSSDIFLIPFSIVWCSFAVFWFATATSSGAPFPFTLFGIPFIFIGLYMVFGRFFADARKRSNTVYAVTSDRIIISSGIFSKEVKSLNIRSMSDITFSQKTDGSGTIILGPEIGYHSRMRGLEWPGVKHTPALEMIDNVKKVYDIIIGLQRQK